MKNKYYIEKIKDYCVLGGFISLLIIAIICAIMLIPSANATLIVKPQFVTNTSIGWNYTPSDNILFASIDGVLTQNFDNRSGLIIVNNLQPNTMHQIKIYSLNDSGSNITNTSSIEKTSTENITDLIWSWIWVIIAIGICVIGAYFKVPFVGFLAIIIALIGFSTAIHGSLIMAIIYVILFTAGIFVGFEGYKD